MKELASFSDLCWEGLTLKHISHRQIVLPYLIFMILALLFEIFLVVLYGITAFLFLNSGLGPNLVFYVSGLVLILMIGLTISIIVSITKKMKMAF